MNPDNIPTELKSLQQWLLWRAEPRDNHVSKIPYRADGYRASSTAPEDWTTFDHAWSVLTSSQRYSGIGFVFRAGGDITGIDLDHVTGTDGVIEPWALRTVEALDSYTEISVSGSGIHIICRGTLPNEKGRRRGKVEAYSAGRYFTMTGHVYGKPRQLRNAQGEIEKLLAWAKDKKDVTSERTTEASEAGRSKESNHQYAGRRRYLNNSELIEKARTAKNGGKFKSLFDCGDISNYQSHSEADLALLSLLLYWSNGDEDRTHELFSQSALYRPKWDRRDYRERCFSYLKGVRGVGIHG
jgi:primase-polymerase (primpol)-like protein